MKLSIDLHTHSIASGHAYSTHTENVLAAEKKGLTIYGISDHGPTMPGGPHLYHFQNFKVIPRMHNDMKVLCGAEANIIDFKGNIDLTSEELTQLDYAIASLHRPCIKSGTMEQNTNALIAVMKNKYINIIGHPDDSNFPLNYEAIVQNAKESNVLLELNNSSLDSNSFRLNAYENCIVLLKTCMKYQVPILLGSDAHMAYQIGGFSNCKQLITHTDFPEDLIVNHNTSLLANYIHL